MVHIGATLLLAPLFPFLEKGLTRRVAQANRRIIREETAGLQQQVESLATRLDQLQENVDAQDAEKVQDQDRIIETLKDEVSFLAVARAMAVANKLGALPDGEVAIHASSEPMIDVSFSWQFHMGDGRFGVSSGTFLGVSAKVESDSGGGTPVIDTIWRSTERAEEVIAHQREAPATGGRERSTGRRFSGTCTTASLSPLLISAATPRSTGSCMAACMESAMGTGRLPRRGLSPVQAALLCWPKPNFQSRPNAHAL